MLPIKAATASRSSIAPVLSRPGRTQKGVWGVRCCRPAGYPRGYPGREKIHEPPRVRNRNRNRLRNAGQRQIAAPLRRRRRGRTATRQIPAISWSSLGNRGRDATPAWFRLRSPRPPFESFPARLPSAMFLLVIPSATPLQDHLLHSPSALCGGSRRSTFVGLAFRVDRPLPPSVESPAGPLTSRRLPPGEQP